jgi:predicted TIM-barrel fold metal-dependent hydrolase
VKIGEVFRPAQRDLWRETFMRTNLPRLSRRAFLHAPTALAVPGLVAATEIQPGKDLWAGLPGLGKIIDAHSHLYHHSRRDWAEADRKLIDAADKLGIDQLCCSILTPRRPATVEGFRECNQWVAEAVKRYPGRVLGYCYVNPGYQRQALEEVRRRIDEGFVGLKLYNEYRCTDPVVFPVIELAISLAVPVLHHAGHHHHFVREQPHISDGGHLAELARRYPEAKLICAHICGGGDWEWTIKALRQARTVSLDLSGSVTDDGVVEMAARVLGTERLLFACDMSMTASVGRLLAADLDPHAKAKILGANMVRLLQRTKS